MKFAELISKSKAKFAKEPLRIDGSFLNVFSSGADWMYHYLHEDTLREEIIGKSTNYTFYGILKYSLALFFFFTSILFFFRLNIFLIPLSIIVFYFVEVHFLFLFPLLLDKVPNPILTSIKCTYRVGLINALLNVIPIGFYMVIGLLRFNAPLRNWYIGCLAIIIWYKDEVRGRV